MSEPYDPYVPSGSDDPARGLDGPAGPGGSSGNAKTAAIQREIDQTKDIMNKNIEQMQARGENLDALADKTENLSVSAQGFRRGANRVRKQMWWKDMKMRMIIIGGLVVVVLLIVLPIVLKK